MGVSPKNVADCYFYDNERGFGLTHEGDICHGDNFLKTLSTEIKFKKGDTVTLLLDMTIGTLRFRYNNADTGEAF